MKNTTKKIISAIRAHQRATKVSTAALAKAIGVTVTSVAGLLSGKSVPNARTASKYAAFVAATKGKTVKVPKANKAGKATKVTRVVKIKLTTKDAKVLADKLAIAARRAPKKMRAVIATLLDLS